MNLKELNNLIASIEKSGTDKDLLDFYCKKRVELKKMIVRNINLALSVI